LFLSKGFLYSLLTSTLLCPRMAEPIFTGVSDNELTIKNAAATTTITTTAKIIMIVRLEGGHFLSGDPDNDEMSAPIFMKDIQCRNYLPKMTTTQGRDIHRLNTAKKITGSAACNAHASLAPSGRNKPVLPGGLG